jgi:hypothetical protein
MYQLLTGHLLSYRDLVAMVWLAVALGGLGFVRFAFAGLYGSARWWRWSGLGFMALALAALSCALGQ